jgi:hypothetical protein
VEISKKDIDETIRILKQRKEERNIHWLPRRVMIYNTFKKMSSQYSMHGVHVTIQEDLHNYLWFLPITGSSGGGEGGEGGLS